MRERLTIGLSKGELQTLNQRAAACGLTATDIARQFSPPMYITYILSKLRGDSKFSESQYKEVIRIIKNAEKHWKKKTELKEKMLKG